MKLLFGKKIIWTLLILYFISVNSFAQVWDWSFGANTTSLNQGNSANMSIKIDNNDNVVSLLGYIRTSNLNGTAIFNPLSEELNAISLIKQAPDGTFLFEKQIFSDNNIADLKFNLDNNDNIYLYGTLRGSKLYMGSDSITFSTPTINNSENKIFVAKFNSDGELLWSKKGESDSLVAFNRINAVDLIINNEYIYLSGNYRVGNYSFLGQELESHFWNNCFIIKMDTLGNGIWNRVSKGDYGNFSTSLTSDGQDVYIVGQFRHSITFDSVTTLYVPNYPNNNERIFIFKIDENGNTIWAAEEGGPYNYSGASLYGNAPRIVVSDNDSNIYIGGSYQDQTGGGGNGVIQRPFVSKYNTNNGTQIWSNSDFTPGFPNEISNILIDSNSNLICMGAYRGGMSSNNISITTDNQAEKSMILKLRNSDGVCIQGQSFGNLGKRANISYSAMSANKSYYVIGGQYLNSITIGSNNFECEGAGGSAFWAKYYIGSPTNISKIKNNNLKFSIYPNPAINQINFEIQVNENCIATIISSTGQIVYTQKVFKNGTINTSALEVGNYYLSLNTSSGKTGISMFSKL